MLVNIRDWSSNAKLNHVMQLLLLIYNNFFLRQMKLVAVPGHWSSEGILVSLYYWHDYKGFHFRLAISQFKLEESQMPKEMQGTGETGCGPFP